MELNNNHISTKDMTHTEWLKTRQIGIGGSDVGCICGLSNFRSPLAVYLSKIGELPKEPQSEQAHFGNVMEEIVAQEFMRATGKKVRRLNKMLRSKTYDFMLANLDRVIIGEKAFLECKTTSAYNWQEWEGNNIPETYMLQIQHYMYVTGFQYCYIACLIGGQKFVWKQIDRDNDLISMIIEIEKDFWFKNVMAKVPPQISGSEADTRILDLLYPNSNNAEIPLPAEAKVLISKLNSLKEQAKSLENEISTCENTLKEMLGENEKGRIEDIVINWKSYVSHRIDTKLIQELYPDIYEKCLKDSKYRKFSIKMPKREE